MTSDETQIESFFAKYEPAIAKLGKALRAKLRARLTSLNELVYVYERQESLVFSYSPSEAGAQGVCALALYPDRVQLFFTGGDALSKSDPKKLLQGQGKAVRHIVMESMADFARPEIEALMEAALKLGKVRIAPGSKGEVILKAEEQKQRAAKAARPASTRRSSKPRR